MLETNAPAPQASRVLAVLRGVLGWALLAAGLWFVWPSTLGGCTTLTVVSGHSMEPTYYTGDLVVARCGTPKIGDVVVYRPSELGGSARIIHRIVGGDGATGWTMKGDNNAFVDPFVPTTSDVVGVALLHLPKVGRVSTLLLSPWLWAAFVLAAVVLLVWPSDVADEEMSADEVTGAETGGTPTGPDGRPAEVVPETAVEEDAGVNEALVPAGQLRRALP